MFVKVGDRLINMDNVNFIETQGNQYVVHFITEAHLGSVTIASILGDTSYADLRAWLKSQAGEVRNDG